MNKKDDLVNNNNNQKEELKANDNDINDDEIIDINLYNQIASTLFNSLSNPIVRNEIKVNENILKYLELQISNLFYLEGELAKKLSDRKLAKEFLQLTANITNLSLSINKSSKKNRIEILEDRNLLIVTIINSCKGVERDSLERLRLVDNKSFINLTNQISALNDFTVDSEDSNIQEEESSTNANQKKNQLNNDVNNNQTNNLNNTNIRNLDNNMINLIRSKVPHPIQNPKFYPYLTKPSSVLILKRILSGALIFSVLFIIMTVITTMFVKGSLTIDKTKDPVAFTLSSTNNWPVLIMTLLLYASFIYIFLKPARFIREKYHISFFILGLLTFWLIVAIGFFFLQTNDKYYLDYFTKQVTDKNNLNPNVISELKNLHNFNVFKIFSYITSGVSIIPLVLVIVLILINPRIDRSKIVRANNEYENAINAALKGQNYEIDPSLFDKDDDKKNKKKSRKIHFTGRF